MRTILLAAICCVCSWGYAQSETPTLSYFNPQANFQLFPTQNIWTFIRLDTRNGKMWQVQFSVKGDRGEVVLNDKSLIRSSEAEKPGRFILYPTKNMYNFVLLDQNNGSTYQVQWSFEEENRGVISIKRYIFD